MAEWLYEAGIGEARAALVEDGAIIRAEREWPLDGPRRGAVMRARFAAALTGVRAVSVRLETEHEAWLQPVPAGFGPGQRLVVEVVRERIFSPRGLKDPKVHAVDADTPLRDGPSLRERIAGTGLPVREPRAFDRDVLEEAGWGELIEEATTGRVDFPGGRLWIEQTEAGVTIDVDGVLDRDKLAVAGATAAARSIGRLGLGGSVLIDLPSVSNRDARTRAAEAFDAAMAVPFERTAVNGFGLLQAVMPRPRPSLMEQIRGQPARAEALSLYRRAEREPLPGAIEFVAHIDACTHPGREGNDLELSRRRGTAVRWTPTQPYTPAGRGYVRRVLTLAEAADPPFDEDENDGEV